ncbi:hypothetical protein LJR030_001237 [Rhizobium sp. LjRoot30]|uniref:hypothetical protein n=1 Tax=Rhizobium sp. LjRoot30 TaxID=3342320 RepID=UPI003ECEA98E
MIAVASGAGMERLAGKIYGNGLFRVRQLIQSDAYVEAQYIRILIAIGVFFYYFLLTGRGIFLFLVFCHLGIVTIVKICIVAERSLHVGCGRLGIISAF